MTTTVQIDSPQHWNEEYRTKGIPSSWKEKPSSVVLWGLNNLDWVSKAAASGPVLDIGCGTGRNTLAVAEHLKTSAVGIDYSSEAIARAQSRLDQAPKELKDRVSFQKSDVRKPLPFDDASFSLAIDIFVYFHILSGDDRRSYRQELKRVLGPDGAVLLSLASSDDGYYSTCPVQQEKSDPFGGIPVVLDTHAGVGNIMHTLDSLLEEWSDTFELSMAWRKSVVGPMHGSDYPRVTLATMWHPRLA